VAPAFQFDECFEHEPGHGTEVTRCRAGSALPQAFRNTESERRFIAGAMKTKEFIKTACAVAEPFRVSKGKNFRLKDVDPDDTLEFTKEEHKPIAEEALE
jgi:hypothetical protein